MNSKKRKSRALQSAPAPTTDSTIAKRKAPRITVICALVLICAIILTSAVLLCVVAHRNSKAYLRYEGARMNGEVVNFFISYYKYQYISSLTRSGIDWAEDRESFWSSSTESGATYGELLLSGTEQFLRNIVISCYLYDNIASLADSDKQAISEAVDTVLRYSSDGDVSAFNKAVQMYGFDYKSYKEAVTMLYKASTVEALIYGEDGSALADYYELCSEYLESAYSHVDLILIRTERVPIKDGDGDYVLDDDGNYTYRTLSESEKEMKTSRLDEIREAIEAYENDGDGQMTPALFEYYLKKWDEGDSSMWESGYYFNSDSEYSAAFATYVSSELVTTAITMQVGEYAELACEWGVYFISKTAVEPYAYYTYSDADMFSDFFSLLSAYSFYNDVSELASLVVVSDKYYSLDVIGIPYLDYLLVPHW